MGLRSIQEGGDGGAVMIDEQARSGEARDGNMVLLHTDSLSTRCHAGRDIFRDGFGRRRKRVGW